MHFLKSTFGPARSLWCGIGLRTCGELPSRFLLNRLWRNILVRCRCRSRFARFRPCCICCGARCRLCGGGLLGCRTASCGLFGGFCAFCEFEVSVLVVVNCILALVFSLSILACPLQPFAKDVHSYLFRVSFSLRHFLSRYQRFVSYQPWSSCSVAAPPPPPVPLHSSAHSVAWEPPVPHRSSQLL